MLARETTCLIKYPSNFINIALFLQASTACGLVFMAIEGRLWRPGHTLTHTHTRSLPLFTAGHHHGYKQTGWLLPLSLSLALNLQAVTVTSKIKTDCRPKIPHIFFPHHASTVLSFLSLCLFIVSPVLMWGSGTIKKILDLEFETKRMLCKSRTNELGLRKN